MSINQTQSYDVAYLDKPVTLYVTRIESEVANVNTVKIHTELNEMGRGVSATCEYNVSIANN